MTIRQKLIMTLGISQIVIILSLFLVFKVLIRDVKNQVQDKRLEEHIDEFSRQLSHREFALTALSKELAGNPLYKNIIYSGFLNRKIMNDNLNLFKEYMNKNHINILEVGDKYGKVYFRFHRPADYGDDKSNQRIIQEALGGNIGTTLEMGNSGLGLRTTIPLEDKGTLLLGQTVSRDFLREIADFQDIKMALFHKDKLVASTDEEIDNFSKNNSISSTSNRIEYNGHFYYTTNRKYDSHGFSNLDLNFFIMVNEDSMEDYIKKVWLNFGITSVFIFILVSSIAYIYSRDMIHAIKSLNYAMKNIEEEESHKELDIKRKDEIGEITKVFITMKEEIINNQKNLESIIKDRTSELRETLKEITELKEHQDGDYFLTSQLIKPLISDNLKNSYTSITSLIRQKKKFVFKKWNSEIGGDISIVNTIYLSKDEYVVFMNADAMGKSIQGAGGALVMGTVFKSILNRNTWDKASREKTPERWLYDCYLDLQSVFLAFDGTMLVSTVIGLLESRTGVIYYINADHPRIVLFRDGIASFLDSTPHINKLGLETNHSEFKVSLAKLEPGDSIILGSDGRDDIIINTEEGDVLNEDENKFLDFVNKSQSDLVKLENLLITSGKLIDDLSLLKVEYISTLINEDSCSDITIYKDNIKRGESQEILKNYTQAIEYYEKALTYYNNDIYTLRKLAKVYERTKDIQNTIKYCKEYINHNQIDSQFLYIISYYSKLAENYEDAILYGERYRLREPRNTENLINLKEVYNILGNKEREDRIQSLLSELFEVNNN